MSRQATALCGLTLMAGLFVLSLFVGVIDLSPKAIWRGEADLSLIWTSRLPRTLAVVITGATLAISGAIMQMMVQNRFVEPMTAGTGHGAALGILASVVFFPAAPLMVKMCIAAAAALASSALFLTIVRRLPPQQPLLVPLVGLMLGGIMGAVLTFFAYQLDMLQYIEIWLTGEFSSVLKGRYELLWIAAAVALASYFIADQFAILGLGETVSVNLGLRHRQVMTLGMLSISVVAALTVVTVGILPFVGLVVPNIVSRLWGDNLRATLPFIALLGAALVLASDILGRLLRYPFEIPVGSVLGVIGAVLFLTLLYARPRHGS